MYDRIFLLKNKAGLTFKKKLSVMWSLVREAEDLYTSQGNHIISVGKKFQCNLCVKGIVSPFSTVEHVRGSQHQYELDRKYNCHNLPPLYQNGRKSRDSKSNRKNIQDTEEPGLGKHIRFKDDQFKCLVCNVTMVSHSQVTVHVKSEGHQLELGKILKLFPLMSKSPLSFEEKLGLMWKMVSEAENGFTRIPTFKYGSEKKFFCVLCDRELSSPFNVVQHAQGKMHQTFLDEDRDMFASGSETDADCSFYYKFLKGW